MAVTWTATAPAAEAVSYVGASYGASGDSAYVVLPTTGNRRRVLTSLVAAGTYTTGGDELPVADVGLTQVTAAYVLSSTDAAIAAVTANATGEGGFPQVDFTDPSAPLIALFDKTAEITAADDVDDYAFHVILEGI